MAAEEQWIIQRACEDDLQQLAQLLTMGYGGLHERVARAEKHPTAYVFLVAKTYPHAQIIGTGYLRPWMRAAEISDVMVHVNYRRRGIANQLMQSLIDAAVFHGYTALQLTCDESNIAALNLYQKLGFVAKRPIALGETSALLMERCLK